MPTILLTYHHIILVTGSTISSNLTNLPLNISRRQGLEESPGPSIGPHHRCILVPDCDISPDTSADPDPSADAGLTKVHFHITAPDLRDGLGRSINQGLSIV